MKKLTIVFTLAIIAIIGLYYLQTNTFTASDTTSSKKINSEQKTTPALKYSHKHTAQNTE